jgi:ubiquinone/menaquinone biosynthesis C-methylase UbiE
MKNINNKELFYNNISDVWASKINNSETNKRLAVIFNGLLFIKELKGKKFLEIGCGLGYFSNKAFKMGAKVTGIDIGPKLVVINKKLTPKGNFLVASASKLPFKDSSFDIVLSTEVIEHVDNQDKAIKEMFRVLKGGGTLVITTPNRIFKPLFDLLSLIRVRPYHGNENWYYPWELKQKLQKYGLIVEESYFNFFLINKFFNYFENIKYLKYLMINQGYKITKSKKIK